MKDFGLIKRIKQYFRKDERAVVLRAVGNQVSASLYRVSFPEKRITFVRCAEEPISFEDSLAFPHGVAYVMKKVARRKPDWTVAVVDSALATTIHASILLARDAPEEPIDESNLEQHIAQAIWRMYDRERGKAAEKMNILDHDVVLQDARVRRIRLDDHKVVSPLGFKARAIEFAMSQTFSTRDCIEAFRECAVPRERFLLVEAGAAAAECLARGRGGAPFFFALAAGDHTALYLRDGASIAYVESFAWGRENVVGGIADALGLAPALAEVVLGLFLRGQASPRFLRAAERILMGEFQLLLNGITTHLTPAVREVYLHALFPVPEFVFSHRFVRRAPARMKLIPADNALIRESLGFDFAAAEKEYAPAETFLDAMGIFAFSFLPRDATIDTIANRHARWLTPQ